MGILGLGTLKKSVIRNLFVVGVLILLAILSILRLANGTTGGLAESGSWDFYPFWHHGQFLRLGTQWAYDAPGATAATYTPAVNILLSSLSYIPFAVAKVIWITAVLSMVLIIPWVIILALPVNTSFTTKMFIALSFYSLTGISIAIRAGQPSVFIVFLIVLSFWCARRDRKFLAGVMLGFALSKFSLSVPLLIYYLYKRQWRVLFMGLLIQLFGILTLLIVVQSSFPDLVSNYRNQLSTLAGASHINLIHIAGHFPHTADQFMLIGVVLSVLIFGSVWMLVGRNRNRSIPQELYDYNILAFLNSWGLVVFYVQQYDIGTIIFAISLLICSIERSKLWDMNPSAKRVLIILTVISLFSIVSFPGLSYVSFTQVIWGQIRWKLMTFGICGMIVTTIWLLRRSRIQGDNIT